MRVCNDTALFVESCALRMKDYIMRSEIKMKEIAKLMTQYKETGNPVYMWGISSDFFIAASLTDLPKCNIMGLIDRNTDKQQLTYKNMKISPPDILKRLTQNDTVFIFSVYNNDAMRQYLYNLSIKCNVIDVVDILK
jgi:hypothetical protein